MKLIGKYHNPCLTCMDWNNGPVHGLDSSPCQWRTMISSRVTQIITLIIYVDDTIITGYDEQEIS